MKRIAALGALAIFFSLAPQVLAQNWSLDKHHSAVQFGVKHIFSTVFGKFSEFEADLVFDPEKLDQSRFDFKVTVASIDTGNTKRDNHLRSGDFFDEEKFPLMRFTSSRITHKGGKDYLVAGTMTLKDKSLPMEIPFVFHGTAPSPFKKSDTIAGFDTRFDLDRLAFGVGNGKFYDLGVVDRTVHVMISVEAIARP